MILASIHSQDDWENAKKAAATARCNGQCDGHPSQCDWVWLGASFDGTNWIWVDGTTFDYQPDFFEISDGADAFLSGWISLSCYGKGDGWHDALTSVKQQALCGGVFTVCCVLCIYGIKLF